MTVQRTNPEFSTPVIKGEKFTLYWRKWLVDLHNSVNLTGTVNTVATLPVSAVPSGLRSFVTDSTVAASGNFGAAVTGGGTHQVPVHYDGTIWRIG